MQLLGYRGRFGFDLANRKPAVRRGASGRFVFHGAGRADRLPMWVTAGHSSIGSRPIIQTATTFDDSSAVQSPKQYKRRQRDWQHAYGVDSSFASDPFDAITHGDPATNQCIS